jgi:hypothetical protein
MIETTHIGIGIDTPSLEKSKVDAVVILCWQNQNNLSI